ncbi:hypothetical protein OIU79_001853 [Salix purpurea]|uniref:Uncharacterized protein n=1 Tax=Salix purpurea TaxID=77065 RepID=A0A9Q0URQ5_SALPP|nr:hypothetical protein OIU79_001853 [Salix purpurea]
MAQASFSEDDADVEHLRNPFTLILIQSLTVTMHDVLRGFSEVQTDPISFNDDVFGNIFRCKLWTETRLKAIMVALKITQMIRSLFRLEKESTMSMPQFCHRIRSCYGIRSPGRNGYRISKFMEEVQLPKLSDERQGSP